MTLSAALEKMEVSKQIAIVRAFRPLPKGRWEEVDVWFDPKPMFAWRRRGAHFSAEVNDAGTAHFKGMSYPVDLSDEEATRLTHANMRKALKVMGVRTRIPGA